MVATITIVFAVLLVFELEAAFVIISKALRSTGAFQRGLQHLLAAVFFLICAAGARLAYHDGTLALTDTRVLESYFYSLAFINIALPVLIWKRLGEGPGVIQISRTVREFYGEVR